METLNLICGRFFDITSIPVSCRTANGIALFRFPSWACDLSESVLTNCIERTGASHSEGMGPVILTIDQHYMIAVLPFNGERILFLGPVNISATQGQLPRMFESLSNQPPLIQTTYSKFSNAVLLFAQLVTGRSYDPADLLPLESFPPVLAQIGNLDDHLEEELQSSSEDQRKGKADLSQYSGEGFEHQFLTAIEKGDTESLMNTLKGGIDFDIGLMSFDPIRQQKYLFVTFMTMAVRAAVRGGLPPGQAYDICNEYCRRMDQRGDIQQISSLLLKMAEQLSEGVRQHGKRATYSEAVRICCDYVDSHLYVPISLTHLARVAGLCERSISQRFNAEVGISPVDYIHAERIRVAKSLLRYTNYTLLEISGSLQFSSQSYFTKIFRELEGLTPGQYRSRKDL